MKIEFTEIATKEFLDLDKSIQIIFKKAIEKILENPFRRYLKYGIPSHVINVTKQARIVYDLEDDLILILHCFSNHCDYEKWYKSYK